jgi:hypothetical protein
MYILIVFKHLKEEIRYRYMFVPWLESQTLDSVFCFVFAIESIPYQTTYRLSSMFMSSLPSLPVSSVKTAIPFYDISHALYVIHENFRLRELTHTRIDSNVSHLI